MVRAYSSVVEHYVDIVGVASSILATPTIHQEPRSDAGFFAFYHAEIIADLLILGTAGQTLEETLPTSVLTAWKMLRITTQSQ